MNDYSNEHFLIQISSSSASIVNSYNNNNNNNVINVNNICNNSTSYNQNKNYNISNNNNNNNNNKTTNQIQEYQKLIDQLMQLDFNDIDSTLPKIILTDCCCSLNTNITFNNFHTLTTTSTPTIETPVATVATTTNLIQQQQEISLNLVQLLEQDKQKLFNQTVGAVANHNNNNNSNNNNISNIINNSNNINNNNNNNNNNSNNFDLKQTKYQLKTNLDIPTQINYHSEARPPLNI